MLILANMGYLVGEVVLIGDLLVLLVLLVLLLCSNVGGGVVLC